VGTVFTLGIVAVLALLLVAAITGCFRLIRDWKPDKRRAEARTDCEEALRDTYRARAKEAWLRVEAKRMIIRAVRKGEAPLATLVQVFAAEELEDLQPLPPDSLTLEVPFNLELPVGPDDSGPAIPPLSKVLSTDFLAHNRSETMPRQRISAMRTRI
jgi:hypothetical protein